MPRLEVHAKKLSEGTSDAAGQGPRMRTGSLEPYPELLDYACQIAADEPGSFPAHWQPLLKSHSTERSQG